MRKFRLFDLNEWLCRSKQVDCVRILAGVMMAQSLLGAGSSFAGEAKPGWEVEWEKTLAMARQEGQVNLYATTPTIDIVKTGVFQKAYPGIRVVTGAGGPAQALQRLMAERRAGKYLADLYTAGATSSHMLKDAQALDPIKPILILPEVVDESKWWGGKHHYNDHDQQYIFVYAAKPQTGSISYNTNIVNIKEIRSFWDFLHSKWKGKILAGDVRTPGAGSTNTLFFYHNPQLGPKFIKRLYGEMDVTLFRDLRQSMDWLARGRFAICFFCADAELAKRQGLPVAELDFILKEGTAISSRGGALSLVNKAPHPNAAKVFVNWLLSREGQLTSQIATERNSRRTDIPKDMIPVYGRIIDGVHYVDAETPERGNLEPVVKIFEEALAETEKRKKGQ